MMDVLAGVSSLPNDIYSLLTIVARVAKKEEQRYSLPWRIKTYRPYLVRMATLMGKLWKAGLSGVRCEDLGIS